MTIPVECPFCGITVGEVVVGNMRIGAPDNVHMFQAFAEAVVKELQFSILDCNNHKTTETKVKKLFGLLEQSMTIYHETDTSSLSYEYLGPPNKFWLWIALIFVGENGVAVNGKYVWWDLKMGFFGEGIKEIDCQHLERQPKNPYY